MNILEKLLTIRKKKHNVLVVGSNGMLGQQVCKHLRELSTKKSSLIQHVWKVERKDYDFSTQKGCSKFFDQNDIILPDIVVNCAGFTDTAAIQSTVEGYEKSYRDNVILPTLLARACASKKIKLIHISTDYVSSELSKDVDFPANIYGLHKLFAERCIMREYAKKYSDDYLIIRTSWLFGDNTSHKTFIEKFLLNAYKTIAKETLQGKDKIDIFAASNTIGYPTSTHYLSEFIGNAIKLNMKHIANGYQPIEEYNAQVPSIVPISRYDWAKFIFGVVASEHRAFDTARIDVKKKEFPIPTVSTAVHHPQDYRFPDAWSALETTSDYYKYNKCISASSSYWKTHTIQFLENPRFFDELEAWIFSQLSEEEKTVIEKYPRIEGK